MMRGILSVCILCAFSVSVGFEQDTLEHPERYESLKKALTHPESVTKLLLYPYLTRDTILDDAKHLPPELGTFRNLRNLSIACLEHLEDLPGEIGKLGKLETLVIDNGNGCEMNISIPESIGDLKNLKVLRLFGAIDRDGIGKSSPRIYELPESLGKLQNLESLDLGRNQLPEIPPQIAPLRNLKKLNLQYNAIGKIPEFLGNLQGLRILDLSYNRLHEIPSSMGGLKNLQGLDISCNYIKTLPASFSDLKGLKISMGNNSLTLKQQKKLIREFPDVKFDFSNAEDANANQDAESK